jgi:hypothetical protein
MQQHAASQSGWLSALHFFSAAQPETFLSERHLFRFLGPAGDRWTLPVDVPVCRRRHAP